MHRRILPLALLSGLLLLWACSDSSTDPADGPASLSVYLTDAPGDVANVWVQIDDVLLAGQGQPLSILSEPTELIDLLALEDSTMVLVDGAEIEAGTYSQLRFVIGAGVLEATDGTVYAFGDAEHPDGLSSTGTLHCPSCAQSGLKVNFAGGLELEETENAVLVDFDVAQSFGREAGQSGRWVMRPLIQGVITDPGDLDGPGGAIAGEVLLAEDAEGTPIQIPACAGEERSVADFIPMATSTTVVDEEDSEPLVFAGSVSGDGTAGISVLAADTYSLGHAETVLLDGFQLVWVASVDPSTAAVASGETTAGVTWTVEEVRCEAVD